MEDAIRNSIILFVSLIGLILFLVLLYKVLTYKLKDRSIGIWLLIILYMPINWLFKDSEGNASRRFGGIPNIFGLIIILMLILLLLSLLGIVE